MTKRKGGGGEGKGGRSKPPKEHQWGKGQSGNPKGRPKKKPDESLDTDMVDLILAEAFKTITVTEGGKPCAMPAIQAVQRTMLVTALKGNSHAQRSYIQQVMTAQAQQQKRKQDAIAAALSTKIELETIRDQSLAKGLTETDMPLHPSDVEIDGLTGKVTYFLALTDEQRKGRAKLVELRDYLLGRIAHSLAVAAEDGDDELLQMRREAARRSVLKINQSLPSRFRRVPPGNLRQFSRHRTNLDDAASA